MNFFFFDRYTKKRILLAQKKYVMDLPQETVILCCKPINDGELIDKEKRWELIDKERYHRMVGKLIYLSPPRADIAYASAL